MNKQETEVQEAEITKKQREFEQEAMEFIDLLYNSAVQMTGSQPNAEDLVQDTYAKAFKFFHKFKKGTNCKAWLFKIMRNVFINNYRKKVKTPAHVSFEEIEKFYPDQEQKYDFTLEEVDHQHIFDDLLEDDVKLALDALPLDFKMAIILSDIKGFSYQEIADIMECPIGTVRSRLSRARRMLQKRLFDFAVSKGLIKEKHGV